MTPSEDDLNCLLKAWTVPPSPQSLEDRLRRAYRDRARSRSNTWRPRARWIADFLPTVGKGLFAGVAAGAVVSLLVIARAFPQSPPAPITMDSEFLVYKDDGSSSVSEYRSSSVHGLEGQILSRTFPGDPLQTAADAILDPVTRMLQPIISPLFYKPGRATAMKSIATALAARIQNGCVPSNMWGRPMTAIGDEKILNYPTRVFRFTPEGRNERFTAWLAPDLECFSLRSTTEKARDSGGYRLVNEMRVLKVTVNRLEARSR